MYLYKMGLTEKQLDDDIRSLKREISTLTSELRKKEAQKREFVKKRSRKTRRAANKSWSASVLKLR